MSNKDTFYLADKLYQAKLRIELEATDAVLKRLMADCAKLHGLNSPQSLFSCLKSDPTQAQKFWDSFPNAIPYVGEWYTILAQAFQSTSNFSSHITQLQIWSQFLCRLSLDSWLVLDLQTNHGNEVLRLLITVIEDVLYSQFRISLSSPHSLPPPSPSPMANVSHSSDWHQRTDPRTEESWRRRQASPFASPAPSPRYQHVSSPYLVNHVPPAPILEVNESSDEDINEHDEQLQNLQQKTRIYVPKSDERGFPVKLDKLSTTAKSKRRKKKTSSNKSRSRQPLLNRSTKKQEDSDDEDDALALAEVESHHRFSDEDENDLKI